ncbi:unnamed protein product [Schistocephalus solidus]|uniref:Coiled-coil domain-containing protein 14 n=1 Tax=Schistocephalus solidus TaxID=70667 RepID=A0A183TJW2_SCHSO|nr:unnamed protein product [Schistocephalus solidus]
MEVKRLQVPRFGAANAPRRSTPPRRVTSFSVHCQTEREREPSNAVCSPPPPSPQVMEVRLRVDNSSSSSAVSKCVSEPIITGSPCLNQCYSVACHNTLGPRNLQPSNSDKRVVRCVEELALEMRDLTRTILNMPYCGHQYGAYYSQPHPPPSIAQMACMPSSPLDTALLSATRDLNERLRDLGRTMHHMVDQYPLHQGDQRSGGYNVPADAAILRLLTALQGNMRAVVRGLRTAVKKSASFPRPPEQNLSREKLEVNRLLAEVARLIGGIRRDFKDITRDNNQEFGDCVTRAIPNCSRQPGLQTKGTIPSISIQPYPRPGKRSKITRVDIPADSEIGKRHFESEAPEEEIHFERPPVQKGCSEAVKTMASLPGKACIPLSHPRKRPKMNRGSGRTGSKSPKDLKYIGSSVVSPRHTEPKLTVLSKNNAPKAGEKRMQPATEALKPLPASSGQALSFYDDVPKEVLLPPNDIPVTDNRPVRAEDSSSSVKGCLPVRAPLKCLQREKSTTSAPQSPSLKAKHSQSALEVKIPTGTQQDTKENRQPVSGGAVLKTSTHVINAMDEDSFPLRSEDAAAEINIHPEKSTLRENFRLEHPVRTQFLGEIHADVNTVLCEKPNPPTEGNYAAVPCAEMTSGLPVKEFASKDLEKETCLTLSQMSEEGNQTEDVEARCQKNYAQIPKRVASAREQLASVLDLLDRCEQQDYTEEEFLRELEHLNLESDLPSTHGYYAPSFPRALTLLPERDPTVVRLPPTTTSTKAHRRNTAPNARSEITPAVDNRYGRRAWPTEDTGLDSNEDAEASSLVSRRSQLEPFAVVPKSRRSDSSDASTPEVVGPKIVSDKNQQKDGEVMRHLSPGMVERIRSHSVDEAGSERDLGADSSARRGSLEVKRSLNGEPSAMGPKGRRAENSDASSTKNASPKTMNDKNRQKDGRGMRHPSPGIVEKIYSKNVEETDLTQTSERKLEGSSSGTPRSLELRQSSNEKNESLGAVEGSSMLTSLAEKGSSKESQVGKEPSLVPEIKIGSESSRGFPDAPTEKQNTDDSKPPLENKSFITETAPSGPILRVIDCRPIPFLGESTSGRNSTNPSPTLGSDSSVLCKDHCGKAVFQEILQDYYKLLAMAGREAATCPERCMNREPHLSSGCQTYRCRCTEGRDDWHPICQPPAYGECSERPFSEAVYTDRNSRPGRSLDDCRPLCRSRNCPACGECSERQLSGAMYTVCDRTKTSNCYLTPCRTRKFVGAVNVPEITYHPRSGYKSCDEFPMSCQHLASKFPRCTHFNEGTTASPLGASSPTDRRTFHGDSYGMTKVATEPPNYSWHGFNTSEAELCLNGCRCRRSEYAKCFEPAVSKSGCNVAKPRFQDAICRKGLDPCQRRCPSSTLNPILVQNFHSSATPVEDCRNRHGVRRFYSTTDGDSEEPTLATRSDYLNSTFRIDCDVYRRGSTPYNQDDKNLIKRSVPETPTEIGCGTQDDIDTEERDQGRFQDEAGSTMLRSPTSVIQSQDKTRDSHEEPACSSSVFRRQSADSRQESESELRTNCEAFVQLDTPKAAGLMEAPNQESFCCHESPRQSDVRPHSLLQSEFPCQAMGTPPAVHRSSLISSQTELDTNPDQLADARLMDILGRVGDMVCTSFPPNGLLSDALAVVNASLDARYKARSGLGSKKSFSTPTGGKHCDFQPKLPEVMPRKRSSEYFKVWWLDKPVKMKRRKKRCRRRSGRRNDAEVDAYRIAEEKASALSENGTDQLIQILDLLERRETTDKEAFCEMQTAQWPQLDSPYRMVHSSLSNQDANPEFRTCCCCAHSPTSQQPINLMVFPPPQQYPQTNGCPAYDPRPVAVSAVVSASRSSGWPWQRHLDSPRTLAPWFTRPPISDCLSALVGGYGSPGSCNSKPLG